MTQTKKIGLALGSGGPKGLAHIGVIKALLEKKVPIDMVAGTSAGAVIGGLFCALGSIEKVEDIFTKLTLKDLTTTFSDIGFRSGVIKGSKIEEFLDKYLKDIEIENLRLPFMALATDIHTGEPIELTSGNLTKAIRTSSSIPGLIGVVDYANQQLVDGGVSEPIPIKGARSLGANYVIAVNLDLYHFIETLAQQKKLFAPTVGVTAIKLLRYHLSQEKLRDADLKIEPHVHDVTWRSLATIQNRQAIISAGYEATINELKNLDLKRVVAL